MGSVCTPWVEDEGVTTGDAAVTDASGNRAASAVEEGAEEAGTIALVCNLATDGCVGQNVDTSGTHLSHNVTQGRWDRVKDDVGMQCRCLACPVLSIEWHGGQALDVDSMKLRAGLAGGHAMQAVLSVSSRGHEVCSLHSIARMQLGAINLATSSLSLHTASLWH